MRQKQTKNKQNNNKNHSFVTPASAKATSQVLTPDRTDMPLLRGTQGEMLVNYYLKKLINN